MNAQKIIADLLGTGLTQAALAAEVGCSQSLIAAISTGRRGKRLSYEFGARLKEMHDRLFEGQARGKRDRTGATP